MNRIIEELEKRGIPFLKGEKRVVIRCPFHEDESPSCGIWLSNGYFKCFAASCGKEGSFLELLSKIDGVPVNIRISNQNVFEKVSLIFQEKTIKVYEEGSFFNMFPSVDDNTEAMEYLRKRKLKKEIIDFFMIRQGTNRFFGRVILPIRDVFGNIISFTARAYKEGLVPKTLKESSPHSTFYGLFEILQMTTGKLPYLLVVEGEFDALYLIENGFYAVANMGTSLFTPEKIRLLRKFCKRVVLCFDGDDAGRKAMEMQKQNIEAYLPTYCLYLPDGKDPDEIPIKEFNNLFGGLLW